MLCEVVRYLRVECTKQIKLFWFAVETTFSWLNFTVCEAFQPANEAS